MNYIGSKKSLLAFIDKTITKVVNNNNFTLSDLFAGTGIVGRFFKEKKHNVKSNDLQYYSYVLNRHYIGNNKDFEFLGLATLLNNNISIENVFNFLNTLPLKEGFIYNNYSKGGTKDKDIERMYFSDNNAKKCDTIRLKIEEWKTKSMINEDEYYFLLTSLLESIDKVANTASIYGAFLKKIKKTALKEMILIPALYITNKNNIYQVYNENINTLIDSTKHDVVYLDPPYNHRQYSGNYHILETIALYDNPTIKGITGMRDCSEQKSDYCKRNEVKEAFEYLIMNIKANYIFLSYNDEGLLSFEEIKAIMAKRGEYGVETKEYKRFKADNNENRNHKKDNVIEYLHYVKIKKED